MNSREICFIMCVNDRQRAEEALYYIKELIVPEGYTVDTLFIEDATGMTAGYNEALKMSDAKYKVYLHQDVLIIEHRFLEYMLEIFEDPKVGMMGMVGCPKLARNGVMSYAPCVGKLYTGEAVSLWSNDVENAKAPYQQVEMVDGLLMATQYDIKWREDLFKGWHFYDASQCQEFIKNGYQIVVPAMERPWCIHDCGTADLENYWLERKKFVREYKKFC